MNYRIIKYTEPDDNFYNIMKRKNSVYLNSEEGKKSKFAHQLSLAPDIFRLLCRLAVDKAVPVGERSRLAAGIAYFVSPLDIMPNVLLSFGYLDAIAVAAFILDSIIKNTDEEIATRNWSGDGNIIEAIKSILQNAEEMLGTGLWPKIRIIFE